MLYYSPKTYLGKWFHKHLESKRQGFFIKKAMLYV